eukprot:4365799-Amphidinium_carterae.1
MLSKRFELGDEWASQAKAQEHKAKTNGAKSTALSSSQEVYVLLASIRAQKIAREPQCQRCVITF